tara:strand:- start:49 stop:1305 length:1257 start_codon:yes stop_codon:yes gene_type:complete
VSQDKPRDIIVGIGVSPNAKGYFGNGLHQNAFYLYRIYQQMPGVIPLLVFHPKSMVDAPDSIDLFGETAHNLNLFLETYHLDALLLVSVVPTSEYLNLFRKKGVKIATLIYGNRYVADQEIMVFGHLKDEKGDKRVLDDPLREDLQPDAVWVSPHFTWQRDYIQNRYTASRSYTCPYIWDSELLDLKFKEHPSYQNQSPKFDPASPWNKNIFCLEPNINVLKTSLFAYQAAALLEKNDPKQFNNLQLYNFRSYFDHNDYLVNYLARTSSLLKEKRVLPFYRKSLPQIIEHGKVMFHHHFKNGLNYTLLEGAHLRLPVVHNSEFMPDLGYYYPGSNLTFASKQLKAALHHSERDDLEQYNLACDAVLGRYSLRNEENILGYKSLLSNLLDKKIEPVLPAYIQEIESTVAYSAGYISPIS